MIIPLFGRGQTIGERETTLVLALCALGGVPTLIAGFAVNPGPPPGSTVAQLTAFGSAHQTTVLLGGWLQITGTLLCLLFALALTQRAGAAGTFAGQLTLFGSVVLTGVGLAEFSGYALAVSGDPTVVRVASQFIPAVQHGYAMVAAPLVFLPLGAVILGSGVLPRVLGYIALILGTVFAVLGLVGVLAPVQGIVDGLSALQGLWWIAAAVALLRLPAGRKLY